MIDWIKSLIYSIGNDFVTFFNPEFWTLIGYTILGVSIAFLLAYFFPVLRGLSGAVVVGLGGMWYGFKKGKDAAKREIPKSKPKKDEWDNWR